MRSILAGLAASFLSLAASTSGWAGKPIYTVLHRFTDSRDGDATSALLLGRGGVLYGTDKGGIYKLTPPAVGQTAWAYEVIRRFDPYRDISPTRLIADASGVLYGALGGPANCVFRLSPPVAPNTAWTYEVLNQHTSQNALALERGREYLRLGAEPRISTEPADGEGCSVGIHDPALLQLLCYRRLALEPPRGPPGRWNDDVVWDNLPWRDRQHRPG